MMCQKLVRDNIPAIIEKNGETCVTRKLTDKEYETALAEKLQEEVKDSYEQRLQYDTKNTVLPDKPDMKKIEELVMTVNESIVKR